LIFGYDYFTWVPLKAMSSTQVQF